MSSLRLIRPAAQVVHFIPGRLRLRVPVLKSQPWLAERLLAAASAEAGVRRVRVNQACASVVVDFDPAALRRPAFARLVQRWLETPTPAAGHPTPAEAPPMRLLTPVGLALSGLALSLLGGPWATGAAAVATALSAVPILRRALSTLMRERRPSVDQLDAAAIALMLALADVRSAALMSALVALGEEIRDRTARRSRRAALDLEAALGRSAWIVRGRGKVRAPVEDIRVGDVTVVYSGDLIPVDGTVTEGSAMVDQKTLTGESRLVLRERGDRVLAATVVADGKLYVRAEAVGTTTRAGWIVRALNEAPTYDTRAANYAARFGDRLVLPTFALAGLSLVATGNLARAASILIVDFATGIRVSAPTAVLATMGRAARDGVLVKGGRALDNLAVADAIVFDKTGTLTRGEPQVSDVISLDERFDVEEILALAAAGEIRLRHPTARAIVRHARRMKVPILERDSSRYSAGLGVRARVDGRAIRVGSARFLLSADIAISPAHAVARRLQQTGASVVYVGVDDALAGVIAYHDPPRAESGEVIRWLKAHGVGEVLMVTGDEADAAHAVAETVGITRVHVATLPEEKADIVRELQRLGHVVAVVGDGINDSPALAVADVSISLRHGADVARETADIVLMDPDLRKLVRAIELSRASLDLIRQNLMLVGLPNVAAMALAVFGRLDPVGATLLSNGSTILAAGNSLRPLLRAAPNGGGAAMPQEHLNSA